MHRVNLLPRSERKRSVASTVRNAFSRINPLRLLPKTPSQRIKEAIAERPSVASDQTHTQTREKKSFKWNNVFKFFFGEPQENGEYHVPLSALRATVITSAIYSGVSLLAGAVTFAGAHLISLFGGMTGAAASATAIAVTKSMLVAAASLFSAAWGAAALPWVVGSLAALYITLKAINYIRRNTALQYGIYRKIREHDGNADAHSLLASEADSSQDRIRHSRESSMCAQERDRLGAELNHIRSNAPISAVQFFAKKTFLAGLVSPVIYYAASAINLKVFIFTLGSAGASTLALTAGIPLATYALFSLISKIRNGRTANSFSEELDLPSDESTEAYMRVVEFESSCPPSSCEANGLVRINYPDRLNALEDVLSHLEPGSDAYTALQREIQEGMDSVTGTPVLIEVGERITARNGELLDLLRQALNAGQEGQRLAYICEKIGEVSPNDLERADAYLRATIAYASAGSAAKAIRCRDRCAIILDHLDGSFPIGSQESNCLESIRLELSQFY